MINKRKHIAINGFILAEVKEFQQVYNFTTTLSALDYLFYLGFARFNNFFYKHRDFDKHLDKDTSDRIPNLDRMRVTDMPVNAKDNKISLYHDEGITRLISLTKYLGALEHCSFSRVYNYLVYLGLDYFVIAGYFKPSTHINFDIELKEKRAFV